MLSSSRSVLRALAPAVLAVVLAAAAAADVLLLEDGRRIEGTIVEETPAAVRIRTNFGTLEFQRSDIRLITREKTRDQIYEERLAACRTAEDFYQLALWCEQEKLKRRAEEHLERAIELDPDHAGARAKLGYVRYEGEWMTPAERDARLAARLEREMREKGLVRHGDRWVTPEDKAKLEQGLVQVDGRWMTHAEALAKQGLAEYRGERMPRERALALEVADAFAESARGLPGAQAIGRHAGAQGVLIGALPEEEMRAIAAGLERARAWFDAAYGYEGGLALFGGRLPEFYVFGDGADELYRASIAFAAERSSHVPEGWSRAVGATLGFTWIDPVAISSARLGPRAAADLAGHCYHHLGHLAAARAGYDGRLLPPWYEEGVAGAAELAAHGTNRVFCRSNVLVAGAPQGTSSGAEQPDVPLEAMRDGSWRNALRTALEENRARPFDKLAQLDFNGMQLLDVAQAMAIVQWLETTPGALARFHRELRRTAPLAPERVLRDGNARQAAYDAAFQAAVQMGFRQADQEWRRWFLSR